MLLLAAVLLSASTAQDPRIPIPLESEQSRAEWTIRELFKVEYAKQSPLAQTSLARTLLRHARGITDDPPMRFVGFREAADVAARSGNPVVALSAAGELCKHFRLDAGLVKHALLAKMEPRLTKQEDFRELCEAYLRLADEDWESDQPGEALWAAKGAQRWADKVEDPALVAYVRAKQQLFQELNDHSEAAGKALASLAQSPLDPAANGSVGEYRCFDRADWDRGLPHLARTADPELSGAAKQDLSRPSEAGQQVLIGDAWHRIADKLAVSWRKELVLDHALQWYRIAHPHLQGAAKESTARNIEELEQRREPAPDALVGRWSFDEGEGSRVRDSSASANHGAIEKGVSWADGVAGKGLSFDGSQGFASLGVAAIPPADKAQTIAWAEKIAGYPKRSEHAVVLSDVSALLNLTAGLREDRVVVWKWGGVVLVSAPAPLPDEWHFYAYSFDGTTHKLYVDGFLKDQSTIPAQSGSYSRLELGRWLGHDGKGPSGFFSGSIDELRVYARVLSDDEVRLLARKKK